MDKTKKIWEQAKQAASDKEEMKSTLSKAGGKLKNLAQNSTELRELKDKLQVLIRMIKSHISGDYRSFPASTLILVLFAVAYFVTPTDLIPDFIPALGFSDDASVVFLIARKLKKDIQKFTDWEEQQFEKAQS